MKKFRVILTVFSILTFSILSGKSPKYYFVDIKTNKGVIVVKLYNETPLHRDNFVKLCKTKFYNEVLFHRVIKNFVIQAGDPESKSHKKDIELGDGELKYKVPAEIIPGMFHKKGVLAAARESDSVNPERASSSTHFYIAIGKVQTDEDLAKAEARINKANKTNDFKFLPEVAKVYKTIGGIPHLDTQYTIFGEVVKGLEIAENISLTATDKRDRPLEDIVIISTKVRHLRKY